jgi:hypothetical protein
VRQEHFQQLGLILAQFVEPEHILVRDQLLVPLVQVLLVEIVQLEVQILISVTEVLLVQVIMSLKLTVGLVQDTNVVNQV